MWKAFPRRNPSSIHIDIFVVIVFCFFAISFYRFIFIQILFTRFFSFAYFWSKHFFALSLSLCLRVLHCIFHQFSFFVCFHFSQLGLFNSSGYSVVIFLNAWRCLSAPFNAVRSLMPISQVHTHSLTQTHSIEAFLTSHPFFFSS